MIDPRTPHPFFPRVRLGLVTAASVLLLLAAGMAVAQPRGGARVDAPRMQTPRAQTLRMNGVPPGAPGERYMAAPQRRAPRGYGPMTHGVAPRAGVPGGLVGLRGLPVGTEVTVRTFGADPADGAEPVATLTLTVGQDAETVFANDVAEALQDAAFVQVVHGERTLALDLEDDLAFGFPRGARAMLPCFACLEQDQSVQVEVYQEARDSDPAATFTFTQGVDSAIGFAAAVRDAAIGAARVEATLPATERTIDLTARTGLPFGPWAAPRGWRW